LQLNKGLFQITGRPDPTNISRESSGVSQAPQ